jgi:hypothetical protein
VRHPSYNLPRSVPPTDWPVVELVVLEVAHRLHFDYGIELERIDEAEVLPFTLLGSSGLIHEASQRYFHTFH